MRVLLVAVSAPAQMTGVHRHAMNLANCLLQRRHDVDMVIAPWQFEATWDAALDRNPRFTVHVVNLKRGMLLRNLWHCTALPKLVNDSGADIVHFTYPVPFIRSLICRPVVLTLHDLYPVEIPENFGPLRSIFNRRILHLCLRGADAIAAVSDHTLRSLNAFMPAAATKALRIYNACGPVTSVAPRCPRGGWTSQAFLLCVAQHRRNKNLPLLLRAFHRLLMNGQLAHHTRLVIVGVEGPETSAIQATLRDLNLGQRVVFLAGLSEGELLWCYRNAMMLVAPSLTEGFGFPVAEAIQTGCRFVCSDIPAFREIGDGHGHFFSLAGDTETNLVNAILLAEQSPPASAAPLACLSENAIGEQYANLYCQLDLEHLRASTGPNHGEPYENRP